MAIARPVTKTKIQTVEWGIPITDEVNRLTTLTAVGAWTALPLTNGWVNWGAGVQTAQYRKEGDLVYIRGGIKGPGSSGQMTTALPAGFLPPVNVDFPGLFYSGTRQICSITVTSSGLYANDAVPNTALLTINGIVYSITA